MKRSTNGVMGLVAVTVIIGMFLFGGMFLAAISANLNVEDVEGSALEEVIPMANGMTEILIGLSPLLLGFGILTLIVLAALFFFRAARKHR